MNGQLRIFKESDYNCMSLYSIIKYNNSTKDDCFSSCKSFKEAWDLLDGKYNDDNNNVIEESYSK